jgi:hypothetical protein
MIAGGSGYTLAELALPDPLPLHPCGFAPLDQLTGGGLAPGAVWSVAGPPRVGVTSLVSAMALTVGKAARVALANDHVATHLLRDRLHTASEEVDIASWVPLPDYRSGELSWFGADYDLLIIDCLDEMLRPRAWPKSCSAVPHGRWLQSWPAAAIRLSSSQLVPNAPGHPAAEHLNEAGTVIGPAESSMTSPTCRFSSGPIEEGATDSWRPLAAPVRSLAQLVCA